MSQPVITTYEMIDFLERFARGTYQENANLISATFANDMIKLFEMENCLID